MPSKQMQSVLLIKRIIELNRNIAEIRRSKMETEYKDMILFRIRRYRKRVYDRLFYCFRPEKYTAERYKGDIQQLNSGNSQYYATKDINEWCTKKIEKYKQMSTIVLRSEYLRAKKENNLNKQVELGILLYKRIKHHKPTTNKYKSLKNIKNIQYCVYCRRAIGSTVLKYHVGSERHRKRVKRGKEKVFSSQQVTSMIQRVEQRCCTKGERERVEKCIMHCELCDTGFSDEEVFYRHFSKVKHKQNIVKMGARELGRYYGIFMNEVFLKALEGEKGDSEQTANGNCA